MSNQQAPLRRLADALPHLLDSNTGILAHVAEHPCEVDSPRFIRFNGMAANTQAFGDYKNFAVGGGASTNRDMALAKTVGECIERYCAAIYDKNTFPLFCAQEAPFTCIHPTRFVLYSEQQYAHPELEFDPFTEHSPVRWVSADNLVTGKKVHVPAAMVYVPYFFYEHGEETPIIQPISSGLSFHCTYEEAAIGGICEVIERDDFMITWQAGLSRQKIRLDSLSAENQHLLKLFTDVGYAVHLMDISNETCIPGVMAVATNASPHAVPIVVAASVSLDPEEAVRKSLEELAHTERYAYQIKFELDRLAWDPEFDNVLGQVHHVNFWMNPAVTQHAEFLYGSEKEINFEEMKNFSRGSPTEDLQTLISVIQKSGYEVIVKDITSTDIASLGMHAIRAIIPGYHPLFMGYHKRVLGGKRLWSIPQKLGFKGLNPREGDYPFPHPFP